MYFCIVQHFCLLFYSQTKYNMYHNHMDILDPPNGACCLMKYCLIGNIRNSVIKVS